MADREPAKPSPADDDLVGELSKILADRRARQIESLLIELDPRRGLRVGTPQKGGGSVGRDRPELDDARSEHDRESRKDRQRRLG